MSDKLNVILIQIDSLCRHFLSSYGNTWINAPNLTAFAHTATTFDNHFTGSLPCMPARREIWTGTEEFWWRAWGPLEPWDKTIAQLAREKGVISQLITDHYHLFEWGSHSFYYDYSGFEFIRGHELDNWRTDPIREISDWARVMLERDHLGIKDQYLRNVQDFNREEDFFAPKVMTATANWLERNHNHEQFFLHVDCFDVHEPFHIPEPYRSMYTNADYRNYSPWPNYGRTDMGNSALYPEEVAWVRAQFAGKLTMVDTWLGRVFDVIEKHKLRERTAIIITTDHGHYLGDHGWIGKPFAPIYHTLSHIPLLIWHPDGAHNGKHIKQMTQTVDLYATVLDLLGADIPEGENIHGRSFASTITGDTPSPRDYAVYGYSNRMVGITTDEWTLLRDFDPTIATGFNYTNQIEQMSGLGAFVRKNGRDYDFTDLEAGQFISGVNQPVWRAPNKRLSMPDYTSYPREDVLFHNPTDPTQDKNVAIEQPDVKEYLLQILRRHMDSLNVPEEQYARLRL